MVCGVRVGWRHPSVLQPPGNLQRRPRRAARSGPRAAAARPLARLQQGEQEGGRQGLAVGRAGGGCQGRQRPR